MSLDRQWFSALIGGFVFVGNLYMGIAFLGVAAVCLHARLGYSTRVSREQLYDIGRILLGFCMLWGYLFWSQYLVIWFGDLPDETAFVAKRTVDAPWAPLSWVVLAVAFAIPFVLLLSREIKRHPAGLLTVAGIVLGGMWLERFILVTPSLWTGDHLPIGPLEILVTQPASAPLRALLHRLPAARPDSADRRPLLRIGVGPPDGLVRESSPGNVEPRRRQTGGHQAIQDQQDDWFHCPGNRRRIGHVDDFWSVRIGAQPDRRHQQLDRRQIGASFHHRPSRRSTHRRKEIRVRLTRRDRAQSFSGERGGSSLSKPCLLF